MFIRIASAFLWYIAVGWSGNLLGMVLGLPSLFGVLLGLAAAAFVLSDAVPGMVAAARRYSAPRSVEPALGAGAFADRT